MVSAMAGATGLPVPPCSIGIHPWQVGQIDVEIALKEIETASVSAIGEIGLDYSRPVLRRFQTEVLEAQLKIARERNLPVVLHCVRAFEPMMKILAEFTLCAVIFHGFTGSRQQAVRAVEAGYYLSFGERSLLSPKTVEAMNSIPLPNLFFETDDSGIPIAEIYSRAAIIKGMGQTEIKREIYNNYIRIFGA